ncbi:FecR family protein [Mangrovibacterium marinum]|uniref:FecR family protein n=1 Tax=Mangrovibacterium marinum TaxID=1639118 RepID=A0A2T5C6H4_9BACT|nr:FecR domain-containing protein [Mangrovibacterium marinum]PTN10526.1 FecR family protein [Mangrovibacterium marinum]
MPVKSDQIYEIITRKLTGTISNKENQILDEWISKSLRNQIEFEDIQILWEKTGEFQIPSRIDQNVALDLVHQRADIKSPKIFRLNLLYQAAAILVLAVLLAGTYSYFFSTGGSSSEYYEEVFAAIGTRTHVDLPDGSRVYLNSGSSLRFSNQFTSKQQRRLELEGEAYFDVAKDPKHPFIVKAGPIEVEALGTEFNVDAYNKDRAIEVTLLEGKVAINPANKTDGKALIILDPNEMAHFNVKENKISKIKTYELEKYVGWINGKLLFMDDPIQEVMLKLENWYNVDIRLEDQKLNKYRFTGTFIDESVDEVLRTLSLTSPLSYEITPAQQDSQGRYTKRIIKLKIN